MKKFFLKGTSVMYHKKTDESEIENYFRTKAEKNGFLCLKFISPGTNGVPDRILIGHGHTVFVELKAPGKEQRILQKKISKMMEYHGARVFVIDTKEKTDLLLQELIQTEN